MTSFLINVTWHLISSRKYILRKIRIADDIVILKEIEVTLQDKFPIWRLSKKFSLKETNGTADLLAKIALETNWSLKNWKYEFLKLWYFNLNFTWFFFH